MGYRTLKSIFHKHNESKMKEEYIKRFNSLASFNTNINIINESPEIKIYLA